MQAPRTLTCRIGSLSLSHLLGSVGHHQTRTELAPIKKLQTFTFLDVFGKHHRSLLQRLILVCPAAQSSIAVGHLRYDTARVLRVTITTPLFSVVLEYIAPSHRLCRESPSHKTARTKTRKTLHNRVCLTLQLNFERLERLINLVQHSHDASTFNQSVRQCLTAVRDHLLHKH